MGCRALLIIFLLASPATAHASPPDSPLRFAIIDDVPSTHLAAHLLSVAYEDLSLSITTEKLPSRRALLTADMGEVDGDLFRIASVGDQYPNLVGVPYPLLEGQLDAVTGNPDLIGLQSLDEIDTTRLRVTVRRGVIIAEQTAEALDMVPVRADRYDQMRALLEWQRVDLALVSDIEGFSPLHDPSWDPFYVFPEPAARFQLFHYLHRQHAELVVPLAAALEKLDRSGERAQITSRYQTLPNEL
ncbi:hypothetical protein ACFOZ5_00045 [Marinobacter lacisalsi]|uniref:Solute-binding protein family 3/N-terminal domain-containing protein n=1 Tax=Marinobacter lacisalsi TaxID=475979 RepID=A0ABV8QDK3_9GAMM